MDICYDKCTYVRCIIILYSQIKNICKIFYCLNKLNATFPKTPLVVKREICRKFGFYLSSNYNHAFPSPYSSSIESAIN